MAFDTALQIKEGECKTINLPSRAIENIKKSNGILESLYRVRSSLIGGDAPKFPEIDQATCLEDLLEEESVLLDRIACVLQEINSAL